jgi:hypothetical protein
MEVPVWYLSYEFNQKVSLTLYSVHVCMCILDSLHGKNLIYVVYMTLYMYMYMAGYKYMYMYMYMYLAWVLIWEWAQRLSRALQYVHVRTW